MGQGPSSPTSYEIQKGVVVSSNKKWHLGIGGHYSKSHVNGVFDFTFALPDECLALIFVKLSCQDKNTSSLVCKRWRTIDSISRHRLVIDARLEMSSILSPLLTRFNLVSVLSLKCSRKLLSINDEAFSHIPILLSSLKKLKLRGCHDITDEGIQAFSLHHPLFLSKLSFASCGFGWKGLLSLLLNCPSLKDLTLKGLRKLDAHDNQITKKALASFSCKLERICLKDLHNASLFIPLISFSVSTLKTLIVCRSSGNWDQVLQTTLPQTNQQVQETPMNITTSTSSSSIVEIQMENVHMGDEGLTTIATSCPDLQVLYLSRATSLTDDGLSAIANSCKKLRKLHIDATWKRFGARSVGEEGLCSIALKSIHLEEIVLMGVHVSVLSLSLLASNCKNLERMALCNTDTIGDSEMGVIGAKFVSLKKLCIKNCPNVSDVGIQQVVNGCLGLVKLKVKRCRGVTMARVSKSKGSLMVSIDLGSMVLDGERVAEAADNPTVCSSGVSNQHASVALRNRSTRTHVLCNSLLMSKFGNALQLHGRRGNQ